MTSITYERDGSVTVECYGKTLVVPADVTGEARDNQINSFITANTPAE